MWLYDNRNVPDIRTQLPGPLASSLVARDQQFISPSYTRIYPLVVKRGSGAVIEDVDGNLFLDFTAGIAVTSTGHCHPHVVKAIQDQAAQLLHMSGTDFYYQPEIALAERLARLAPGPAPKKVFFSNSGAEAIEAALKLARWYTRRSRVIAFLGGFHGRTYGAMSVSASKAVHRAGFAPLVPEIHHVPFPRAHFPTTTAADTLNEIEDHLFHRLAPANEVAAVIIELIQGEGGYYPVSRPFLQNLQRLCHTHGILLIVDEVQTGCGRTGSMFACDHWEIVPDIICLAKGIASGLPLGAIISSAEIMSWPPGSHASTFGGNPVACQAALATLDLLENEYIENARSRGQQLLQGLQQLSQDHEGVANPRGLGLMLAIDLVDPHTGAPQPHQRDLIINKAFQRGLLLLSCGTAALRLCPPLCVTGEQVNTALRILNQVL